jgi:two-component system, response regulator RegA
MSGSPSPQLMLVDDDDALRSRLARAMAARGFAVSEAATGAAALAFAIRESVDFAVVDLRLPDMNGLDVVRGVKTAAPGARVVVLTGYGSIATALEAVRLGASDYLTKPVDADEVTRALADQNSRESPPHPPPTLARVEWEHINRILMDCDGNVTATAQALGIHRRSLQRKLAKFPTAR